MSIVPARARRLAPVGAALVAVAVASGCAAASTVTVTVTATPPSAPVTSASAGSNGGQPAAACATRNLRVSLGNSDGAAGTFHQVIDFTNLGSSSCTLYGYPGVAMVGGSPVRQIGAAAARIAAAGPELVTLPPHGEASSVLVMHDAGAFSSSACEPRNTTYLQVYPPNQTTALFIAYPGIACAKTSLGLLAIAAVRPGAGDAHQPVS